jgi:hypothetical protein
VDSAKNEKEKEEYLDQHFKYRHRAHGTIRFIGELFLYNLLTSKIMRRCIDSLLSSITEENITSVCYLLTTVGKKLQERITAEQQTRKSRVKGDLGKQVINEYIKKLELLKNAHCITTSRVRFEIMNVLELRKANWKPRESAKGNAINKTYTKSTSGDEMSFAPQKGLWNREPVSTSALWQKQPTETSNLYGNLSVDCDDQEPLPSLHHSRSSSSKGAKKEKPKAQSQQEYKRTPRPARVRTPSPDPLSFPDIDSYFTIDLSDEETVVKASMEKKIKAFLRGELTIEMITIGLNLMKITGGTLAMVYSDFLEKKEDERNKMAAAFVDLLKNNALSKTLNTEALSMMLQLIPTVISDVPRICDYIGQFLSKFFLKFIFFNK